MKNNEIIENIVENMKKCIDENKGLISLIGVIALGVVMMIYFIRLIVWVLKRSMYSIKAFFNKNTIKPNSKSGV